LGSLPSTAVILSEPEGAQATEGESKDPERLSLTMRLQGISTRNPFPFLVRPAAERRCVPKIMASKEKYELTPAA
jgi:hypothetical protein